MCWEIHARAGLTTETGSAQVSGISYNTSFAHTLGYPDWNDTLYTFCQCILYTVHSITTVLFNYTISGKIGIDVVI